MPPSMLAALLPLFAASPLADEPATPAGKSAVFIGTYTGTGSHGIYRFDFDPATGEVTEPRLAAEATSPSFLAIAPSRRFLYAVGEVDRFKGEKAGAVLAFAIDPKTGDLTALNDQSSGGSGPCHLTVDKAGKNVLVANYGGGSAAVLPVDADGRLRPRSSFVQHEGSGADPRRQKEPHAHSVNLDAANRFAFVADLGLDKVLVYRFDPDRGTIAPNDPPAAKLAPAAGPRHFAFHPSGRFAYAIGELNSTVTGWSYDPDRGALTEIQTITTLPSDFRGSNHPAEVQVHPSGKFLYGSNRGHNSIVAYTIDPDSGKLTYVAHQGQGIKNPRNFGIDPTGRWMLVGSQDTDTVLVFSIDGSTGALTPTGRSVKVAKPVCVKFWTPPGA
jgi:6-phosphogluconolactonase